MVGEIYEQLPGINETIYANDYSKFLRATKGYFEKASFFNENVVSQFCWIFPGLIMIMKVPFLKFVKLVSYQSLEVLA